VEETEALGASLAAELRPDGVLLLSGELGSGKTALTRGLAAALGVEARQVLSPTFTLIREHTGTAGRLVHVDLYRLEPEETAALGLDEVLAMSGVKVVEWAERLPEPPRPSARQVGASATAATAGSVAITLGVAATAATAAGAVAGAGGGRAPAVLALHLRRMPEAGEDVREIVETPEVVAVEGRDAAPAG
jgi:tRNA threonylcarbamoyladenosine biosynthesis protein TsaE